LPPSHTWTRNAPAMFVYAIGAAGHGRPVPAWRPGQSDPAAPLMVLATRHAARELDRCRALAAGTSLPQDRTAHTEHVPGAPECTARHRFCQDRRRRDGRGDVTGSNVVATSRARLAPAVSEVSCHRLDTD